MPLDDHSDAHKPVRRVKVIGASLIDQNSQSRDARRSSSRAVIALAALLGCVAFWVLVVYAILHVLP